MNLAQLKRETAADHSNMETLVPLMGLTLEEDQYRAVLRRFYGFVRSWEIWSEANAPRELRPLLADRQRSGWIAADLHYFGEHLPKFHYSAPAKDTPSKADFLGAMYVIEGSTLGGQYIARHVEDVLGLVQGQGDSYFRGSGDRTGSMWKEFQKLIEALPDQDAQSVITAAKNMFAAFGDWMRYSEPVGSEGDAGGVDLG